MVVAAVANDIGISHVRVLQQFDSKKYLMLFTPGKAKTLKPEVESKVMKHLVNVTNDILIMWHLNFTRHE